MWYYWSRATPIKLSFRIENCLAGVRRIKEDSIKSLLVYAEVPLLVSLYLKGI